MRNVTACIAVLFPILTAGCAYDRGVSWELNAAQYRGEIEYKVADFTDPSADPPRLAFRISASLTPDNEKQDMYDEVHKYVPYHFGNEMGNLAIGIVRVVESPIIIPLLLVFPSREYTIGDHFTACGNDLNFVQANPDNDDTMFRTQIEREKTGNKKVGEWTKVGKKAFATVAGEAVSVSLPDLGFSNSYTTDAMGRIDADLAQCRQMIGQRKAYKVRLIVKGKEVEQVVYLGK